jgi:hypothetical protein
VIVRASYSVERDRLWDSVSLVRPIDTAPPLATTAAVVLPRRRRGVRP